MQGATAGLDKIPSKDGNLPGWRHNSLCATVTFLAAGPGHWVALTP
jgi:hypothetical protein